MYVKRGLERAFSRDEIALPSGLQPAFEFGSNTRLAVKSASGVAAQNGRDRAASSWVFPFSPPLNLAEISPGGGHLRLGPYKGPSLRQAYLLPDVGVKGEHSAGCLASPAGGGSGISIRLCPCLLLSSFFTCSCFFSFSVHSSDFILAFFPAQASLEN